MEPNSQPVSPDTRSPASQGLGCVLPLVALAHAALALFFLVILALSLSSSGSDGGPYWMAIAVGAVPFALAACCVLIAVGLIRRRRWSMLGAYWFDGIWGFLLCLIATHILRSNRLDRGSLASGIAALVVAGGLWFLILLLYSARRRFGKPRPTVAASATPPLSLPSEVTCAEHVGVQAIAACARCGTFYCGECGGERCATHCRSCETLQESAVECRRPAFLSFYMWLSLVSAVLGVAGVAFWSDPTYLGTTRIPVWLDHLIGVAGSIGSLAAAYVIWRPRPWSKILLTLEALFGWLISMVYFTGGLMTVGLFGVANKNAAPAFLYLLLSLVSIVFLALLFRHSVWFKGQVAKTGRDGPSTGDEIPDLPRRSMPPSGS